jgi:anti-sigma factor RsiW
VTQTANTYEELSCQELVELVTDYLEGALPAELHERFELHIAHCSGCQTYLEQMRATIRVTGTLTQESLAPEAERELLDAFRGWTSATGAEPT